MSESVSSEEAKRPGRLFVLLLLLGASLAVLCHDAFKPNNLLFSNDSPLGFMQVSSARYPGVFTGHWSMESWIGGEWPVATPTFEAAILMILSPEEYLKVWGPSRCCCWDLVFGCCSGN